MRLIDADVFKKILSEYEMKHNKKRSFDDYAWGASNAYEHASDLLDEMPTVERPHGEWIPKAVHNCWTRFECSVCGYYHEPVHDFGESKPDFNFCPNCGADMREGEVDAKDPDNR